MKLVWYLKHKCIEHVYKNCISLTSLKFYVACRLFDCCKFVCCQISDNVKFYAKINACFEILYKLNIEFFRTLCNLISFVLKCIKIFSDDSQDLQLCIIHSYFLSE